MRIRRATRHPGALAAALLATVLLAGCGGGSGKESEATQGSTTVQEGVSPPSLKEREAASIKREQGELAALKRSQQRARAAREAAAAEAAKTSNKTTGSGKSGTGASKKSTSTKKSKSGSGKKKGTESEAERKARKRFEEEEAAEAKS